MSSLRDYAPRWQAEPGPQADNAPTTAIAADEAHALGWLEPERYAPVARQVVQNEILPSSRALELILPEAELERLLATNA